MPLLRINGRPLPQPRGLTQPGQLRLPGQLPAPRVLQARGELAPPEPPDEGPSVSGLIPYEHQKIGMRWLRSKDRGLLADEMRLGKTIQVLRAATPGCSVWVVCPASLRYVWRDAAEEWAPWLRWTEGPLDQPQPGELRCLSYASLPAPLSDRVKYLVNYNLQDTIVVPDEVHYCKSSKSKRAIRTRLLCQQAGRVHGLTGTPLPGSPFDLWGVLSTLGLQWRAFGNWQTFVDVFHGRRSEPVYRKGSFDMVTGKVTSAGSRTFLEFPKEPADERIHDLLAKVMLRRLKSEVTDLPPKTYTPIRLEVPHWLEADLNERENAWQKGNLRELPAFTEMMRIRKDLAFSRIEALTDLVEQYEAEGTPLVVFSAHKAPIESLARREGWGVATGDTSKDILRMLVDAFQTGLLNGLALTIGVGGVGIDLSRADHVHLVDRSYRPDENAQAVDRLENLQKKRPIFISWFETDHPLDRRQNELLLQKEVLIKSTVGG